MASNHRVISDEPGGPCVTCGSPATSPVHLPDGSPHPDYSFEQTERDLMSIEQNLSEFVLNIPAILELRQQVGTSSEPEDLSPSLWDAVSDVANDAAERYFETQVDMVEAVESAINHGYVDLSSVLDYDEIVSNSSEFGDVQGQVQDNKDAIDELTSALDNLSDANDSEERITRLEQTVADLESRLDEVMSRLDNASLDI